MWECAAVISYLSPQKVDWCAAAPQPISDPWAPILQVLANGLVMAAVLTFLFLWQEKYKSKRKRAKHARSIFQELDKMREQLWPELGIPMRLRPNAGVVLGLSRSTYDGLVSSATISTLSDSLQRQLNGFYNLQREGDVSAVEGAIVNLMEDVENEKKNAEAWRFWKLSA